MSDEPLPPNETATPLAQQQGVPALQRWRMRIAYAAVGFVVGASSVGIAWWATSGSEDSRPSGPQITVTGKVTVFGSWVHGQGDEGCVGIDSYADLRNGTPVRVFDLDGHELAQGRLENGTAGEVVGNSCTWPLTVKGVPSGAVQYQVQVGDRDRVTKVREELQAGLTLSYGQQ